MLEQKERLERVSQQLRAEGYRLTPQRMAIMRVVMREGHHHTAEDVYQQVAEDFPMLSLATVYKTLSVLETLGEVAQLEMGGRKYYDGNPAPHPHLICVQCHRITDLPAEIMTDAPAEEMAAAGFRPLWRRLDFYGLCAQCQAEQGESALGA